MNRFVTFGSAVGRPLLMAWVAATFMLSPLVSGAGVGVEWSSGRSADGRFFQLSFEASLGDLYTIESSHDLEDWTAEATYWGLGQTIRYAIYQYSGGGSELGDPVVSNPGIVFATLQISKVAGGGILLGWPSLQPGSSAEPAHHYLASAVLEGEWPDLGAGVYGNYHITYRCLGSVLEQVPEPLSLGAEDAAFASQFLASLPEMNAVAGTPAERIASVVATGLGEDSFCYYRIRRHYNLDSDGDGLSNKAEIEIFGTNWLFPDSNFDGISDSYQLHEALKQQFDAELAKKADIVDGRLVASQVPGRTYLLLGQSNALGNAAITGSDNTARPCIQIFDRDAGEFVNWDILNPVPGMVARENFAYRLAQQLEKVGVNSRFVACAVSGASIASFLPNTGSSMLRLEADLKAAGMPGIDGVIWMQGETDGYARMSAATYKGHFEAIKRHLGEILGNNQIPWVVGELAAGLHSQDSKNLVFDSYAADPLVRVMPNRDLATLDGVHFTGKSLVEMGSMAFAAINGSARTSSDPILYQQWAEKTVDLGGIKITDFGNSTHDTGSGYLRMNVHGEGDRVKADLVTTGFAVKIGTGQSSRFDRYGARISFRISSLFPANTTLVFNLGVHPTVDSSENLTVLRKGVQLRISGEGVAIVTSDGIRVTEQTLATAVSAGHDVDSFVLEIERDKALLYRSKENQPKTLILECGNVPQGEYGGYSYGANLYLRADEGAKLGSLYLDMVKIAIRRYGL